MTQSRGVIMHDFAQMGHHASRSPSHRIDPAAGGQPINKELSNALARADDQIGDPVDL